MAVKQVQITKAGCANQPVAQLMRGDTNTCKLRLMMRREPDGVDLGGLAWSVVYCNADGTDGVYTLQTAEAAGLICGEWLIGGNATAAVGKTMMHVEGVSQENGVMVWASGQYHLLVSDKLDGVSDEEVEEHLTPIQELIAQIKNEILPPVIEAGEAAAEAGNIAKEAYQHPPVIRGGTWWVWDWETGEYNDTGSPAQGGGGGGGTVVSGVSSVNGKTGAVTLTAKDVGALPDTTEIPEAYVLPTASATVKGGVKIGERLEMKGEVLNGKYPFAIVDQPADQALPIGAPVVSTVKAVGKEPLSYVWYYKNPDMSAFVKSSVTTPTMHTEMTEVRNGRQVYCVVTDGYGDTLQTRTATLTKATDGMGSTSQIYMPYFTVGEGLEYAADVLSAATLKRTVDQMSIDKVDKKFGQANAGKLMYVGESGDMDLLQVGDGLELENGVMSADVKRADVERLYEEIANLASESEYELIGATPVTLEEMSDIKIQASGEAEYTIQTPTVGDFEQLLAAGSIELSNCSVSKVGDHYEVVTTADLTGFYQAWVGFIFDGLEIGKSYKLFCNAAGLPNDQFKKKWHGSLSAWSGTDTSGSSVVAGHNPHKGVVEFTATATSIYVRYYPATTNPDLLAGWIGNFYSMYVNHADMSYKLTAIYSASGNFDGVLNAKSVPPMAVVSATPIANVYRKASTDITLTQAGKPADGKVTGERIAMVADKMPLWGKTIANFGDSIFGNARPPLDVSTFLASNTGATVYNCAFGGCRMSQHVGHWDAFSMYRLAHAIANNDYALQDDALNYDDRVSYAEEPLALIKALDFANLDIMTVSYGTNDFTGNNAIDNADNPLDTTTVCGALRYSIETLLTAYPNLRIFVLLPTYRFWIDSANAYIDDAFEHVNNHGKTLVEYNEAIAETAKAYNVPVIDNFAELGINKVNRYQYFPTTDGTHHNENGRKLLAKHIAAKLW